MEGKRGAVIDALGLKREEVGQPAVPPLHHRACCVRSVSLSYAAVRGHAWCLQVGLRIQNLFPWQSPGCLLQ